MHAIVDCDRGGLQQAHLGKIACQGDQGRRFAPVEASQIREGRCWTVGAISEHHDHLQEECLVMALPQPHGDFHLKRHRHAHHAELCRTKRPSEGLSEGRGADADDRPPVIRQYLNLVPMNISGAKREDRSWVMVTRVSQSRRLGSLPCSACRCCILHWLLFVVIPLESPQIG